MGKISNVYYKKLTDDEMSVDRSSSFYFLNNMFALSSEIQDEYERYEEYQINLRNKIIGNAVKHNDIPGRPKIDSTVMGISGIHDCTILVTEYE